MAFLASQQLACVQGEEVAANGHDQRSRPEEEPA